jgi:hypothetical protein
MGLWGGLEGGGNVEQFLDLNAVELLAHFFSTVEMVNDLHLLEFNAQQQTLLKAALLQEVAKQVAGLPALRTAVRNQVQATADAFRAHPNQ